MARTLDIFQARDLAKEIVLEFADKNMFPKDNFKPNTMEYILWMANQVAIGVLDDENQINRWIGFIQMGLITNSWSTLEQEKTRLTKHMKSDDYRLVY